MTFGSLFERGAERWGFRGDPKLWQEMGALYAETPMPDSWFDVNKLLAAGFEKLTGAELSQFGEPVRVERFRTGSGMSDGGVNTKWWATIGEALIVDRWAAARPDKAVGTVF